MVVDSPGLMRTACPNGLPAVSNRRNSIRLVRPGEFCTNDRFSDHNAGPLAAMGVSVFRDFEPACFSAVCDANCVEFGLSFTNSAPSNVLHCLFAHTARIEVSMTPVQRNILSVLVGFGIGSVANLGLITVGMSVIPLPEGVDMSTMESVRANMAKLDAQHFIFPFLGHSLGTLIGAFLAAKIAATHKMKFAMSIGVLFLLGGVAMILNCGGPLWFILLDLVVAYLPVAFLGGLLGSMNKASS
jgi:hypothetical protein